MISKTAISNTAISGTPVSRPAPLRFSALLIEQSGGVFASRVSVNVSLTSSTRPHALDEVVLRGKVIARSEGVKKLAEELGRPDAPPDRSKLHSDVIELVEREVDNWRVDDEPYFKEDLMDNLFLSQSTLSVTPKGDRVLTLSPGI